MANKSHVPKFGNWDGDNVPYTAYFENARREKSGVAKINPNDPEQNPEAFGNIKGISPDKQTAPQMYINKKNIYSQQQSSTTANSTHKTAEYSSSDRSLSDNSVAPAIKPSHHRKKSDRSKFTSGDSRYSPSQADDYSYRSVSVPKFGEWDEKDPRSAEGFTVIFNKVKEEKQIAAAKLPPVPLQTVNNYEASQKKETRKRFCCLF